MDTWNREELYAKIWASPATQVAKEYGVSDVAIAKVCRKLQIPVPGRGYWAKKQNGYKVEIKPLPKIKEQIVVGRMGPSTVREAVVPQVHPDDQPEWERIDRLFADGAFQLATTKEGMKNALLVATRNALRKQRPDDRKMVSPNWQMPALSIDVSAPNLERALEFYACLIQCVRKYNADVLIEQQDRHRQTVFQAYDAKITIRVFETAHQRFLNADDANENGSFHSRPRFRGKPIEYVPTGKMIVETGGFSDHLPRVWREGKRSLQELLPDLVRNLFKHALMQRRWALDRRHEEEMKQRRQAELLLLRKRIEEEERRVLHLLAESENWKKAKTLREYVVTVIDERKRAGEEVGPDTPLGIWVTWALQQADRLDPLAKSPPSILDRKKELALAPEAWRTR